MEILRCDRITNACRDTGIKETAEEAILSAW